MLLHRRRPAPQDIDHELLWLTVSLGAGLGLAAWFAAQWPIPPCLFHSLTGMPCLTCGATRAAFQFLHGHFIASWLFNPLAFLLFCGLIVFDLYALAVLATRAPRIRIRLSPAERNLARAAAALLLGGNWLYLLTAHIV